MGDAHIVRFFIVARIIFVSSIIGKNPGVVSSNDRMRILVEEEDGLCWEVHLSWQVKKSGNSGDCTYGIDEGCFVEKNTIL